MAGYNFQIILYFFLRKSILSKQTVQTLMKCKFCGILSGSSYLFRGFQLKRLNDIVWMVPLYILEGLQVKIFDIILPFFPLSFFYPSEQVRDRNKEQGFCYF